MTSFSSKTTKPGSPIFIDADSEQSNRAEIKPRPIEAVIIAA